MRIILSRRLNALALALALVCFAACASTSTSTPAPAPPLAAVPAADARPLFERLGGLPAITAAVDGLLANIAKDERINARFANADLPHLKQMLIDQICEASGGGPIVGCKYTGKNMIEAHAGQLITDEEFTALVEDLIKSLDALSVPEREKNDLLTALGAMKTDIVGK